MTEGSDDYNWSWVCHDVINLDIHSGLPARPNRGKCLQPNLTLIRPPTADPTVH